MKYYRIEFIYDFYEIIKTTNKIQKGPNLDFIF